MKAFKHSHTLRIKKEKDCQSHQVLFINGTVEKVLPSSEMQIDYRRRKIQHRKENTAWKELYRSGDKVLRVFPLLMEKDDECGNGVRWDAKYGVRKKKEEHWFLFLCLGNRKKTGNTAMIEAVCVCVCGWMLFVRPRTIFRLTHISSIYLS